jgi:hypothetical protein
MSTTYRGGCSCGAVRHEITAEPRFGGHCQCRDCQRATSGGHASFMAFPTAAVKLTGTPRFYETKADNGDMVRRGFCPTWGSPVASNASGMPDMMEINVGSLDHPAAFKPEFVIYASRGHAWDHMDPALPSFLEMPPTPDAEQPAG